MKQHSNFLKKVFMLLATAIVLGSSGIAVLANDSSQQETTESTKEKMQSMYGENQEITGAYDTTLSVKCNNGTFVGQADNSVISFKGIPYAKSPTGELRWKSPESADDSDKVYEAYYYGASPLQSEWPSEVGSYYKQSEDCLKLNVWSNSTDTSTNKTVMVFFHGGSYGWGATSDPMYDCQNLVSNNPDVIAITVEYRVGLMGFVDFSSVEGGDEYSTSGNLGLLDQICALKWIQKNIAAFGGNPDNVTIWGESAGSGSVSLLPLIDGTKGLFKRVIAESGAVNLTYSKEECQSQTEELLKVSGCKNMAELQALSTDELSAIIDKISDNNCFPERDGVVLPEDVYAAYESGAASDVDMLIGTNADECRYWIMEMGYYDYPLSGSTIYSLGMPVMFENNLKKMSDSDKEIAQNYISSLSGSKTSRITEFYNEMLFRLPTIAQCEYQSQNGAKVYNYYWNYGSSYDGIGACHAVELAYVFGNLNETIYTGNNIDASLSQKVQNMWVNFARTGDPSIDGYKWDEYNTSSRMTMVLGKNIHQESDLKSKSRKKLSSLLSYGLNGCYSQLSLNVPSVYKYIFIVVGVIAILVITIFNLVKLVIRKIKNKTKIS